MLHRLLEILGLARSLIALRTELALVLTGKSLTLVLLGVVSAFLAAVGTLALLAAAVVALSPVVGYAVALVIAGVATIAAGAIVWQTARRRHGAPAVRASEAVIRSRIDDDQRRLQAAMGGGVPEPTQDSPDNSRGPSSSRTNDTSAHAADGAAGARGRGDATGVGLRLLSPTVTLAAGFAAVALFGPSGFARSLRLMTAVGSAVSLANGLRRSRQDRQRSEPSPARPVHTPQSQSVATRRRTLNGTSAP